MHRGEAYRTGWLRRKHRAQPSETGVCWKGLHAWGPENQVVEGHDGHVRCRLCRRIAQRAQYHRGHRRVPCIVHGCHRATNRRGGENYICPKHRREPPEWIARLGLAVVGTEVVAQAVGRGRLVA